MYIYPHQCLYSHNFYKYVYLSAKMWIFSYHVLHACIFIHANVDILVTCMYLNPTHRGHGHDVCFACSLLHRGLTFYDVYSMIVSRQTMIYFHGTETFTDYQYVRDICNWFCNILLTFILLDLYL